MKDSDRGHEPVGKRVIIYIEDKDIEVKIDKNNQKITYNDVLQYAIELGLADKQTGVEKPYIITYDDKDKAPQDIPPEGIELTDGLQFHIEAGDNS